MRRIQQQNQSESLFRTGNTGYQAKSSTISNRHSNCFSSSSSSSNYYCSSSSVNNPSQQQLNYSWPLDKNQESQQSMTQKMTKTRRSWVLTDRCAMNVHLLKANLAEEGCEISQLDLAKKLLLDSADETLTDTKENSRLAVYWLIKSAEQGNEEATELLKQCLENGQGITCQNIADVRTCINTPKNEKLVFKGAKLLYENNANGEEFITTTQILNLIAAKKCPSPQLDVTFTKNSENGATVEEEQNESLNKTFLVENNCEDEATNLNQSQNNNHSNFVKTLDVKNKQVGVKLTKDDLIKIASTYNNGEIPQVVINSQTGQSHLFQWELYSLMHGFLLQFLLLCLLTKALTLHCILIIISSWLTLWTCYNYYTWRRKLGVFQDWKMAFKTALQKNSNVDISNEKKLKSKQIQPLNMTSLMCMCILFILSCPPAMTFMLASLSVFGIFRGVLYRSGSARKIGLIIILTIIGSVVFTNFRKQELFTTTLLSEEYLKTFLPVDNIEIIPEILKDFAEWWSYLDLRMIVVMINVCIISISYLKERGKNNGYLLEQVILLLWLLQLDCAILSLKVSEITSILSVTIIIGIFFHIFESSKDIWTVFRRGTLLLSLILVSIIGIVLISNIISVMDNKHENNVTDNNNNSESENGADTITTKLEWNEYSLDCHRKAWESKTVQETQLYCSLKYLGSTLTLVSWNGRISNMKIVNFVPKSSFFVSNPEISSVSLEILVNVHEATLPPYEGHSWHDLLRGGGNTENEVKNIILMHISTRDIIGTQERAKMLEQLLQFRAGDSIEFHGTLLRAGGIKPEVGRITHMKCVDCALIPENSAFSFASESFVLDLLNPLEEYLGPELIQFVSNIEYNLKYYFKTIIRFLTCES